MRKKNSIGKTLFIQNNAYNNADVELERERGRERDRESALRNDARRLLLVRLRFWMRDVGQPNVMIHMRVYGLQQRHKYIIYSL